MLHFRVGRSRRCGFLLVPAAVVAGVAFTGFRHTGVQSLPAHSLSDPLVLPAGWPMPPVPADNPITEEKFVLGRQLFYERMLSGDNQTSCGTCHDPYQSFASSTGSHVGAFGVASQPTRNVPRLVNLAYDTVFFWDGHAHTLEQQARMAVVHRGDLQSDTTAAFARLANNPAYVAMFTQAFGDGQITLDRVAKAIATFERCLISGNSSYDQYRNGNTSAMSASAIRGMNLFFDTTQTNCSDCHNNLGSANPNAAGQTFTDNNYYRTGTFESNLPGGGYGLDTTRDSLHLLDAGRAAVTGDSMDIGRFRTPTLRNAALTPHYGAEANMPSLMQVLENYNHGGGSSTDGGRTFTVPFNQDPRIKPLKLDSASWTTLRILSTASRTFPLFRIRHSRTPARPRCKSTIAR